MGKGSKTTQEQTFPEGVFPIFREERDLLATTLLPIQEERREQLVREMAGEGEAPLIASRLAQANLQGALDEGDTAPDLSFLEPELVNAFARAAPEELGSQPLVGRQFGAFFQPALSSQTKPTTASQVASGVGTAATLASVVAVL